MKSVDFACVESERSRINFEVYTALFLAAAFGLSSIASPDDFSELELGSLGWWSLYIVPASALAYWALAELFRSEFFSWRVLMFYSLVFVLFTILVGMFDSRRVLLLSTLVLDGYSLGGSMYWLRRYRKALNPPPVKLKTKRR